MWDRQYAASLALFAAAAVLALLGIVWLSHWLGWAGGAALLAMAGGLLAWFYWGPRPDLVPRGDGPTPDGPRHE